MELDIPIDKARTVINGIVNIKGYSATELGGGRTTYLYLCMEDGGGNSTTPGTIHLDNFRIYKLENSDAYGVGECFLNEDMSSLSANAEGKWAPTSSLFVFVVHNGSETRNISCMSDDGDSNKYLRMNSGDVASRTYFRRSVNATKMFDIVNIATAKIAEKSSNAILYQAKFRIDDVTKANTTALKVTPKIADSSGNASERDLFSINPKDGIATVGRDSTKKTYDGLKLSSKEWYTLNLFHNVASGYMRAEIIDASGNKQVFEGNETDANVDYGYIALFGFENSSEEHTVIDFDDLKVYSAAVSDAETFYTLSDFAADKADGKVTAKVNVSSDMTNVTTGAANDLEKANNVVEAMICNYGLVAELGLSTFNLNNPMVIGLIQEYKNKILDKCYEDVIKMVVENKEKMREFADVLKEKEEMTGAEIEEILYPETADAE